MKKVYIIYDKGFVTKENILQEVKDEGYKHDFTFSGENSAQIGHNFIKEADEVWVWGICSNLNDYKIARATGKDIWQMG